jgi:hypothetical protein
MYLASAYNCASLKREKLLFAGFEGASNAVNPL